MNVRVFVSTDSFGFCEGSLNGSFQLNLLSDERQGKDSDVGAILCAPAVKAAAFLHEGEMRCRAAHPGAQCALRSFCLSLCAVCFQFSGTVTGLCPDTFWQERFQMLTNCFTANNSSLSISVTKQVNTKRFQNSKSSL